MRCPSCGLFNPPSALKCDCGYDFTSGERPRSRPRVESRRSSELSAFLIVPVIATIAWYVLMLCTARGRQRPSPLGYGRHGHGTRGDPRRITSRHRHHDRSRVACICARTARRLGLPWRERLPVVDSLGLCVALAFGTWTRESTVLSPLRAVLIGVATAVAWWYMAGEPRRFRAED